MASTLCLCPDPHEVLTTASFRQRPNYLMSSLSMWIITLGITWALVSIAIKPLAEAKNRQDGCHSPSEMGPEAARRYPILSLYTLTDRICISWFMFMLLEFSGLVIRTSMDYQHLTQSSLLKMPEVNGISGDKYGCRLTFRHLLVTTHTIAPKSLREIVLSAGSIDTPHILLHSGIGDAKELAALHITLALHLPDASKNFTDHPIWSMLFTVSDTNAVENIYFRNVTFQADALAEWQANRTGFLTAGASNQLGFLRIPDDAGVVEGEPCTGNETAHYDLISSVCTTSEPG
ncbi:hypothetical protein DFS33DRAFT_236098 [Desarmillaria ectypa]|nr:hypothetical protein DFS33DRAFT_236098 [Desarmillaria ectypa]